MNLTQLISDLWQNQRPLVASGVAFVVLFVVLAIISFFDSTEILGINRWIKPMKFASSIAIFLWTLAVYLHFLRGYEKPSRIIAWGAIAMMVGEIVLIVLQSVRGKISHFNIITPLDGAIFSAMGLMIMFSTLLIIYLTYLYFRADFDMPAAIMWGMRLGLIVFLLASVEGGYMSGQLKHTVGAMDGGAGLPFVNWSVSAGDLRVAHFVGLHALQAIPLAALLFVFIEKYFNAFSPTILTFIFAFIYTAAFTLVFVQALLGKPLLGKEILVGAKVNAERQFKDESH